MVGTPALHCLLWTYCVSAAVVEISFSPQVCTPTAKGELRWKGEVHTSPSTAFLLAKGEFCLWTGTRHERAFT